MTVNSREGGDIHSDRAGDKKNPPSPLALRRAVEILASRIAGGGIAASMARGYEAMGKLNLALAAEGCETMAEWPAYEPAREEGAPEAGPSGDS